jgi:hypothetical protein
MRIKLGNVNGVFSTVAAVGVACFSRQAAQAAAADAKAYTTWSDYERSTDSAQYSSPRPINRSNVTQLQQGWFYPDASNGFRYGLNPVVDGVMYVVGKDNTTVALDGETGKEIWVHYGREYLAFRARPSLKQLGSEESGLPAKWWEPRDSMSLPCLNRPRREIDLTSNGERRLAPYAVSLYEHV